MRSISIRQIKKKTYVVVGTTLASREDSLVDALLEVLSLLGVFPEEDKTSTGTTECLVPVPQKVSIVHEPGANHCDSHVVVVTTSQ